MNPLWIRPTRKKAKIRLRLTSETPLPRPNLEEKERNVPPTKRTKTTAKDSPTIIQTADGPGEASLHPVSDQRRDGAPAIQGRSVLHGARLGRLGGELEEDLVEPGVLSRVGHPAEAVERSQRDDAPLVDYGDPGGVVLGDFEVVGR